MNNDSKKRIKAMEGLRLPELPATFQEIVGEVTRSPNKKFLLRRIAETLEAQEQEAVEATPGAEQAEPAEADAANTNGELKLTKLSVEELQKLYTEVVGRDTGSSDRRYLIWKIREAEKGRINVGPRKTRARDGEPLDVKILPLRLEADVADKMDEAWRAKGIKNRMEFFRGAIGHYLAHLGARDTAALFTNAGTTGA